MFPFSSAASDVSSFDLLAVRVGEIDGHQPQPLVQIALHGAAVDLEQILRDQLSHLLRFFGARLIFWLHRIDERRAPKGVDPNGRQGTVAHEADEQDQQQMHAPVHPVVAAQVLVLLRQVRPQLVLRCI